MKQIIHAVHIHAAPSDFHCGYCLNSLKPLCEKGAGVPFTPPSRGWGENL